MYAYQEAKVRTTQGLTDLLKVDVEQCHDVRQGCIISPYFFNTYSEAIMHRHQRHYEHQWSTDIYSSLSYADDTVMLASTMEEV